MRTSCLGRRTRNRFAALWNACQVGQRPVSIARLLLLAHCLQVRMCAVCCRHAWTNCARHSLSTGLVAAVCSGFGCLLFVFGVYVLVYCWLLPVPGRFAGCRCNMRCHFCVHHRRCIYLWFKPCCLARSALQCVDQVVACGQPGIMVNLGSKGV